MQAGRGQRLGDGATELRAPLGELLGVQLPAQAGALPSEPARPFGDVGGIAGLAHLAIADDVDPRFNLEADHLVDGVSQCLLVTVGSGLA